MKESTVTLILLVFLMLVSFYGGMATNASDLTSWEFLKDVSTIAAGSATVVASFVALSALRTWKKSASQKLIPDTVAEIEERTIRLYFECSRLREASSLADEVDVENYKRITILSMKLRLRGFSPPELDALLEACRNVISKVFIEDVEIDVKEIPKHDLENLLRSLTSFISIFKV
ncbi:hypothetical protein [Vibrio cionasavignyae]|uniref:hypothetical protein n=1 Tax=Vibrio cionasavignyae TaxID=2910252 RepID=UPI003D0F945A